MAAQETDVISPKKRKLTTDGDFNDDSGSRFENFETLDVLSENSQRKMICLEGKFGEKEDKAVVILEKTSLTKEIASKILTSETKSKSILENDIYSTHQLFPLPELNSLKATLIYPATEKHIRKYTSQDIALIEETKEDYETITKPFIQRTQYSIQWVYNILDGRSESERVVYNDPDKDNGFLLLPDMKWDGKQLEDLYLVAIVHQHNILSIRELDGRKHLKLLMNVRDKGKETIKEKYGLSSNQLRIYLHYQPSYYHLHIHFTSVKFEAPGISVERAVLLSDVIDNLTIDPDFYQKKTLTFPVKKTEELYKEYCKVRNWTE